MVGSKWESASCIQILRHSPIQDRPAAVLTHHYVPIVAGAVVTLAGVNPPCRGPRRTREVERRANPKENTTMRLASGIRATLFALAVGLAGYSYAMSRCYSYVVGPSFVPQSRSSTLARNQRSLLFE